MSRDVYGDPLPAGVLRRFGTRRDWAAKRATLQYAPDGRLLAIEHLSPERVLLVRETATQTALLRAEVSASTSAILSPAGDALVLGDGEGVWDIALQKKRDAIAAPTHAIPRAFVGDGAEVVMEKYLSTPTGTEYALTVWTPATGKRRTLRGVVDPGMNRSWVAGAPRGNLVALGFEVSSGTEHNRMALEIYGAGATKVHDLGRGEGMALAFDRAGDFLAVRAGNRLLGVEPARKTAPVELARLQEDVFPALAVSPLGTHVAVTDGESVVLHDRAQSKTTKLLAEHSNSMAFSPNGGELAVRLRSGRIVRFDVASRTQVAAPRGHDAAGVVAMSPSGRRALTAGGHIYLWDVDAGTLVAEAALTDPVVAVEFMGDDAAVTLSKQGALTRWSLPELKPATLVGDRRPSDAGLLDGASEAAMVIAPAAGGTADAPRLGLFTATGTKAARTWSGTFDAVAIDPTAKVVALATPRTISVREIARDRVIATLANSGRSSWPTMALTAGGKLLGQCRDLDLTVWQPLERRILRRFRDGCSRIAFIDDHHLLVGEVGGGIRVVDALTGAVTGVAKHQLETIESISPSPRGVLVGSRDGTALLYPPQPELDRPAHNLPTPTLRFVSGLPDAARLELLHMADSGGCMLGKAGTLACWRGGKSVAQPVALSAVTDFDTAREDRICAVASGDLYCWRAHVESPARVAGMRNVVEVELFGEAGVCVRLASGKLLCWEGKETPAAVAGVSTAVELAAGTAHVCARRANGRVRCWGANDFGQLGGGRTSATDAVEVRDLRDAVRIAAGMQHSCAVRRSGAVVCWGRNDENQLGDGTFVHRAVPVAAAGIDGSVGLAVRSGLSDASTCAVDRRGRVRCWGADRALAGWGRVLETPRLLDGIDGATDVSLGGASCALVRSGGVVCWR